MNHLGSIPIYNRLEYRQEIKVKTCILGVLVCESLLIQFPTSKQNKTQTNEIQILETSFLSLKSRFTNSSVMVNKLLYPCETHSVHL